jgi:hypothetical protein
MLSKEATVNSPDTAVIYGALTILRTHLNHFIVLDRYTDSPLAGSGIRFSCDP